MIPRTAVSCLCAITMVVVAPSQAFATFPGRNGRIAVAILYNTTAGHGHDNRGPIMSMSSRGQHRIVLVGRHSYAPAWSPDGKLLAFQHVRKHSPEGVYTVPSDGGPPSLLRRGCWDSIAWNPSGHHLILDCHPEMIVVNRRGEELRTLPPGEDPAWSPDGKTIAFSKGNTSIATIDVVGRHETILIPDAYDPDWSPDGKQLAYACVDEDENTSVCIADADGTDERVLVPDASGPEWSPDGRKIIYLTSVYLCGGLEMINVDGTGRERLTGCDADWLPGGYSWQPRPHA